MSSPIVVLDNGASSIKVGLVGHVTIPSIIPNAVVRSKGDKMVYFGHEMERCRDYSSLHYRLPFEKGYLVDWDAQKAVWDGIYSEEVLGVDTTHASLLITEPYFNLPNIQDVYDQMLFEEYELNSYYRCTPASVIPYGTLFSRPNLPPAECMIVVDSGFSFTHVVPLIDGQIIWNAVKRLDVGGKLLTNQLKELISFRQWNMMDETIIVNHVKESCCFLSMNYDKDMESCRRNSIVQEYILPDITKSKHGHIRQPDDPIPEADQILVMNNERFAVPELLFRPDDIGLDQAGLAATIAYSISLLPIDLQGMFWANIGLIGGSTKFPGFRDRLIQELRSLAPVDCEVIIYECDEPVNEAYKSAYQFASRPDFARLCVTRAEYLESGSNASRRKFRDWKQPHEVDKEKPKEGMKPTRAKQREVDADRSHHQAPSNNKSSSKTRNKSSATNNASASTSSTTRKR